MTVRVPTGCLPELEVTADILAMAATREQENCGGQKEPGTGFGFLHWVSPIKPGNQGIQ